MVQLLQDYDQPLHQPEQLVHDPVVVSPTPIDVALGIYVSHVANTGVWVLEADHTQVLLLDDVELLRR